MKIMVPSFRRSHAHIATLSAPNPETGHCRPTSPQETPGHSRASLGQSLVVSLLLSPGAHKVLFVPSKSLFPQSCVSSGSSLVGLMATSSMRAYAVPKPAAPRAPAPVAGHCWPLPPLRHGSVSASVGSLGPGAHKPCLSPLSASSGYRVWLLTWFHSSYHLAGASPLALDVGYLPKVAPVPHSLMRNGTGTTCQK